MSSSIFTNRQYHTHRGTCINKKVGQSRLMVLHCIKMRLRIGFDKWISVFFLKCHRIHSGHEPYYIPDYVNILKKMHEK